MAPRSTAAQAGSTRTAQVAAAVAVTALRNVLRLARDFIQSSEATGGDLANVYSRQLYPPVRFCQLLSGSLSAIPYTADLAPNECGSGNDSGAMSVRSGCSFPLCIELTRASRACAVVGGTITVAVRMPCRTHACPVLGR